MFVNALNHISREFMPPTHVYKFAVSSNSDRYHGRNLMITSNTSALSI